MTTIAYDGKTLAADKRVVYNGYLSGCTTKIRRIGRTTVLACAGDLLSESRAYKFFSLQNWNKRDPIEFKSPDYEFEGFLFLKKKAFVLFGSTVPIPLEEPKFAVGSGADFARSAMELGKTAIEAVRFAARFDINTSEETEAIEIA